MLLPRSHPPLFAARRAFLLLAAIAAVGCANTDEPERPETALGDRPGLYMPPARPVSDLAALGDQTAVKTVTPPEISYDPLPRVELPGAAPDADSDASATPAAGRSADRAPRASTGGGGSWLSAGIALARTANQLRKGGLAGLTGGAKPPGAQPGSAPPGAPPVKLGPPREENAAIPDPPAPLPAEAVSAAQQAARTDAEKNLLRAVFAMPIAPGKTVAAAVGGSADEFAGTLDGLIVVGSKWLDETTLEIEVQITIDQLISALEEEYDEVDFAPLRALGASAALEARGVGLAPREAD